MNTFFKAIILLFALTLLGCSTRGNPAYTKNMQHKHYTKKPAYKKKQSSKKRYTKTRKSKDKKSYYKKKVYKTSVQKALYIEYKKWYRTNYQYGGDDLNGVDCSAFVQAVYRDAFGIHLPRTTKYQANSGRRVDRRYAKVGDLVLFKTGYNTRHAGIIIEKGKFMHASTSRGVTISELNNPYYKRRYWQIRRVLK